MKILNLQEEEIKTFNLGTLEAGDTKEFTYTLYNDTAAHVVELELSTTNSELEIINYPDTMIPFEKATFNIVWRASVSVKKALEANLKIFGKELYKPRT